MLEGVDNHKEGRQMRSAIESLDNPCFPEMAKAL